MLYMFFVVIFIVFMYYFTCISFAIRPSGRKSAIKLIDFCRAMLCIARLLPVCGVRLSVCLSVRPSVTFVSCAKTTKISSKFFHHRVAKPF